MKRSIVTSLACLVATSACFGEPDATDDGDAGATSEVNPMTGDGTTSGTASGPGDGSTADADGTSTTGGAEPFCAILPDTTLACWDFDGDGGLAAWETTEDAGAVTLEEGDAASAPRFLRSRIMGAVGGSATAIAAQVVDVTDPVAIRLEAEMRQSEGCGLFPTTRVFGLAFYADGGLVRSVVVSVSGAGSRIDEFGPTGDVGHVLPAVVAFDDGEWHSLVFEIDVAAATASLSLGGVAIGEPVTLDFAAEIPAGVAPLVSLGQQRTMNADTPCSVDFDSVVVSPLG